MGISWHGSTISVWRQTDTSSVNGVAPHAGTHPVLILNGAGWHRPGGKLKTPANISLLRFPSFTP